MISVSSSDELRIGGNLQRPLFRPGQLFHLSPINCLQKFGIVCKSIGVFC